MSTVELKSSLHQLIDGIENAKFLESIHDILSEKKNAKQGSLWSSLTAEQKSEVLEAYEESESLGNLIPHSEVLRSLK